MRGTRWLLVLAILAILAGIGVTFRFQLKRLQKDAPAKPALLPTELTGVRSNFTWVRKDEGRTIAEVSARKLAQEASSNQVQLEDVELTIPPRDPLRLEPRPIGPAVESRTDRQPCLVARRRITATATRVDPALERVHRRNLAAQIPKIAARAASACMLQGRGRANMPPSRSCAC